MRLTNETALVTGAGRGIGRGIALELARHGARVVVNYYSSERMAHETVDEIRTSGGSAVAVQADVSRAAEVKRLFAEAVHHFESIAILVNNAGITVAKPFLETDEELWDRVIDTNLKSAYLCSLMAARDMAKRGGGKIINISSVHSYATYPGFSLYAASKGGIDALTKAMALDLAPYKINVNAIGPGAVEVEKYRDDPLYDRAEFGARLPWGRIGMPEDIAKAVVFLASDDAEYITGQIFYVDGGLLTRMGLFGRAQV
jgi:NAD(P)-dependent dehydrogenase (short-subunit alcohol dehydrogenase family)